MTSGKLNDKSLAQLRDVAAELDVVGRSRMTKHELIKAIAAAKDLAAEVQQQRVVAASRPFSARQPSARRSPSRPLGTAPARKSVTASRPGKAGKKTPTARVGKTGAAGDRKADTTLSASADRKKAGPRKKAGKNARSSSVERKKSAVGSKPKRSKPPVAGRAPAGKTAPDRPAASVKPASAASRKATKSKARPAPSRATRPEKAPDRPAASVKPASAASRKAGKSKARPAPSRAATSEKAPPRPSAPVKPASRATRRAEKARSEAPAAKTAPAVKRAPARKVPAKREDSETAVRAPVPSAPQEAPVASTRPLLAARRQPRFALSPAAPPLNLQAGDLPHLAELAVPLEEAAGGAPIDPERLLDLPPAEAVRAGEHAPVHYQEDRLVLLARDPHWLYCYWELSEATLSEGRKHAGASGRLVLRVRDTARGLYRDTDLPDQAVGTWYFEALGEDVEHELEMGFKDSHGKFHALARSNRVRTPRLPRAAAGEGLPAGLSIPQTGATDPAGGGRIPLQRISPLLGHPSSRDVPFGAAGPMQPPPVPTSPFGLPSSPLAPFQPPPRAEKAPGKDRSFWILVDAELIVYGATEPDAKVKIQGQPIQLREDGTFSARFALPDGRQEIPVDGESADGIDHIVITPIVTRRTRVAKKK